MSKLIEIKVESFRKIPNPHKGDTSEYPQMYTAICDVKKVPRELLDWMETNPRKQNINGKVGKRISESLLTRTDFHLMNRGLLISAQDVKFNNYDNKMTLLFEDPEVHGDVDGGHTLKIILENQDEMEEGKQFVKIEILTGVESFFEDLAEARNVSTAVKDESIENLKDHYEMIKTTIAGESYKDRVNYMENDDGDIDIEEILSLLFMFNIDLYPTMDSCPVAAYSSKKKCSDAYSKIYKQMEDEEIQAKDNPYYKMVNIMTDIFALYDMLECKISQYYSQKHTNGRYGALAYVTMAKVNKKTGEKRMFESKFSHTEMEYSTPKGILYPILGAFRALVVKDENGNYKWSRNPYDVMDKIGPELVATAIERCRQYTGNPNKTGKDTTLWQPLYMRVMMENMLSK
ncbi:MAG: AIPR family protein [Lachnospiraceae bacterium]|nr:AIPR family protein [Lachnospiraceae bacterium]